MTLLVASGVTAGHANIQSWSQLGDLGLAFVLSTLIGVEREVRQKSAGLRTHALVGVGAALFVLISKYGFNDVLQPGKVVLDPSRVAAQIVTGIGFIGAGLIFVKRGSVHGLTTAAGIWLTAAVGTAAGAGLPLLAVVTVAMYFVVTELFRFISKKLGTTGAQVSTVRVRYPDGRGLLRRLLEIATNEGFSIEQVFTEPLGYEHRGPAPESGGLGGLGSVEGAEAAVAGAGAAGAGAAGAGVAVEGAAGEGAAGEASAPVPMIELTLQVRGPAPVAGLVSSFSELEGVQALASDHRVPPPPD
jgi:putative Mg2+ transporter-C (MgtC) family protein